MDIYSTMIVDISALHLMRFIFGIIFAIVSGINSHCQRRLEKCIEDSTLKIQRSTLFYRTMTLTKESKLALWTKYTRSENSGSFK